MTNSFASVERKSGMPTDMALRVAAIQDRLRELEVLAKGRLGVYILDSATNQEFGYRSDERFMMLSSFKLLACALVLKRVDEGMESLERRLTFKAKDLLPWSPITEKHMDSMGMSLAQLCEATITTSDNTAANLILSSYGGPAALTSFLRQIGDSVTRLDRNEPMLNKPTVAGLMDTTSPRAIVATMNKLLLLNVLSHSSRSVLQKWLRGNTTGGNRLKAGLPPNWQIGDKTGTNETDSNDIGIVYPPDRRPLLVAAYLSDSKVGNHDKDLTLAMVGRLICEIAS